MSLLLQISRLEETWTTLRRNYTQTAISYEKTLKPFYKNLYEGTGTEHAHRIHVSPRVGVLMRFPVDAATRCIKKYFTNSQI